MSDSRFVDAIGFSEYLTMVISGPPERLPPDDLSPVGTTLAAFDATRGADAGAADAWSDDGLSQVMAAPDEGGQEAVEGGEGGEDRFGDDSGELGPE